MGRGRRTTAPDRGRRVALVAAAAALAGLLALVLLPDGADEGLAPAGRVVDVHGLAFDRADPRVLYVATHHGLVRGDADGWWRVGASQDDLMGFTAHPTEPDVFWSSGHPRGGGNLGVQKSTDGGRTWTVVALAGQVDFHAMTASPADPDRLWGVHVGRLHASADGGLTWSAVPGEPPRTYALAADPVAADVLWAAGPTGVHRSADGGVTWTVRSDLPATAIALARDGSVTYAATPSGAAKSVDGGRTWTPLPLEAEGTPGHVAVDPSDAGTLAVATYQGTVLRSEDGGATWRTLRRAD